MNRLAVIVAATTWVAFLTFSPAQAAATATLDDQPSAARNAIAYVAANGYGDDRRFELIVADADGSHPQVILASSQPVLSPSWSPDGRQLAYASFVKTGSAIFVIDVDTRVSKLLVHEQGVNGAPAWSPDGRSLAVSLSFGTNADLYVIDVASGSRRRLTEDPHIDTEPTWAPDGSRIAFTSDRSGLPQLYTVDSHGGSARAVGAEGRQNMRPAYSPDGRSLAFVSYRAGKSRIGLVSLSSKTVSYLTTGPMDDSPSFSPDGASLIYADIRGHRLAVIGLDRRHLRSIPQHDEVHEVAWLAPSAAQTAARRAGFASELQRTLLTGGSAHQPQRKSISSGELGTQ